MATIIRSIAFKNFYNFYGEYEQNCYKFSEGLNIINADNGAGKSKIYNGFLWVIKGQVYDSDIRAIVKDDYEPLKLLSDKAKLENNEVETGVRIVFDNNGERYTVEKRIRYTKRIPNASTSNSDDWDISNAWVDVVCMNLASHDSHSIYDERDKEDILQNRLISPEMQSYALLQGEAIDEIVDLSNAKQLAHTVEILTDISELKSIETTCSILSRNAAHDLQVMQDAHTTNLGRYEALKREKEVKLAFIEKCQESLDTYKYELKAASETYERLQSQVANTENRVKYRERLQTIEEKIKSLIERKSILLSGINDNLFKIDTPWLLLGTDGCIDSYLRLRDEYMQARYKRATAQDPHAFFTTLPEGSPDDGSLDIMLERGWCFVCDRPAPKGSKEWHHIESIRNRSKKTSDENVADLHGFFDGIQRNVTAFSKVDRIKGDVARVRKQIKDIDAEIADLERTKQAVTSEFVNYGGDKNNLNGQEDANLLNQFLKAQDDIRKNDNYMDAAKTQIKRTEEELERIDRDMRKYVGSGVPVELEELNEIISDVKIIFANTKDRIYDAVINELETKANEFYQLLTKGNNVVGGKLKFTKTSYDAIQVEVLTQLGDKLSGASEGFQRMKKIAIVMAIISSKIGDQHFAYPFIADAPFSAFGKNFINNFFDAVPRVFNQSIIMIKDLYDGGAEELITEDGKQILTKMKVGDIPGTFYVNIIKDLADTTGLETEIKPYKQPAYE